MEALEKAVEQPSIGSFEALSYRFTPAILFIGRPAAAKNPYIGGQLPKVVQLVQGGQELGHCQIARRPKDHIGM